MVEEKQHSCDCVACLQVSDNDHDTNHYILHKWDFPIVCPNQPLATVRTTWVDHQYTMWMECACWGPLASVDKVGAHIVAEDSSTDKNVHFWQTRHMFSYRPYCVEEGKCFRTVII